MKRKILVVLAIAAMVLTFIAAPAKAATQLEIDNAIQWGLAWLSNQQNTTYGYFGSGYNFANTATAVLAFENEGHFPGGGSAYSSNVEKGLDFLFKYAYKISINPQTYGYPGRNDNPDTNGNGQGIYFRYNSSMYETGLVMQAIVASNTPDRIVTTGSCAGMTYRQVMEDVVDFLAWAQCDGYTGRGGWYYWWLNNQPGYSDNSVAQWPVLGLVAAEQWGINAPQFVKDEMQYWVTYIQRSDGASGYYHPNSYPNISKTGGLLVEFFYLGDNQSTLRAQSALNYVNSRWNVGPYSTWWGNKGHPYAMFSVFKGLELMQVPTIPNAPGNTETPAGDWWGDYSEYLVNTQFTPAAGQGYWNGYSIWGQYLATPWYIIILQASVFPVSVDVVVPGSACDDTGYDVSVHYSVERFLANGALTIYKDDILFDTITLTDFQGSATANYNIPTDSVNSHTWRAVLNVTGGGISVQTEDTGSVDVYDTPLVTDIPDQYMPFTTFDLDDYQICDCAVVDWSATGIPADWTVNIDADNIVTVTAPDGATAPATITFVATFHWPGIDCEDSNAATFYPNRPPVAHPGKIYPGEAYICDEGGSVQLDGTHSYDPDGDAITYEWDLDGDTTFETTGATPMFSAIDIDNPPTHRVYVFLKVCDPHGACDIATARVDIEDLAPTAAFSWAPSPSDEGSPVEFTDESTSEVDEIVAWSWDFGGLGASSAQNPSFTFPDNGSYNVCLTVTDDDDSTDTVCHDVTVNNVPPTVDTIIVPLDPININDQSAETINVAFSDPAEANDELYTCDFDLDNDGTIDETVQEAYGTLCSTPLNYTEPGVYTVQVTVTDKDGGSGSSTATHYIVIYDPDGGFVTGGGWIYSPEGAYVPDTSLSGKATFGFVSKYKKKELTPSGNTEFQFHAGDLNFHSDTYYWLVIAGYKAMYKGTGTINGAGNYGFMLFAVDAKLHPTWDADRFRIQIWDIDAGDMVVYDNEVGEDINEDPGTELESGSIVIHKK